MFNRKGVGSSRPVQFSNEQQPHSTWRQAYQASVDCVPGSSRDAAQVHSASIRHDSQSGEQLRSRVGRAPSQARGPTDREAASCGDHLILHEVQSDQLGRSAGVEVAMQGIPHLLMQLGNRLGLSEDRLTYRARRITTSRRLFDDKNDLSHLASPATFNYVRKWRALHDLRRIDRPAPLE